MTKELKQQQEKQQIVSRYKTLLKTCKNLVSKEDVKLVRKAFELALEDHGETRRSNGDPAIYRSLSVAQIVVEELGLGRTSVICALLYDIVQKERVNIDEITKTFGPKVAQIISGLVKVTQIYNQNLIQHTENFRKLLLNFADDVRVVLIILADRLFHLRNMEHKAKHEQVALANDIEFLYIPLAHRLGMYNLKSNMEDLALRYLQSEIYFDIAQKLKDTEDDRKIFIQNFVNPIKKELDKLGLKYNIKARTKTVASIFNKMKKKQIEFEEVYDIFALRIILTGELEKEKLECWKVYSVVSDLYRPNPERLRDWITIPKSNGYESLHITVLGPQNRWVEVQIRTQRMDEIAEQGFAAHWKYKGGQEQGGLDYWLRGIREVLESEEGNSIELIDQFKADLYSKEIYVFTPKGDLIQLPLGATLLDFAYAIHTDLGEKCIGGTVNHKNVTMRHQLKNGDRVGIITSNSQKPKPGWRDIVVTARAKNKINQALKEAMRKDAKIGKETLERRMKNWKIEFSEENVRKLMQKYEYELPNDLYYAIAKGNHSFTEIKKLLKHKKSEKEHSFEEKNGFQLEKTKSAEKDVLFENQDMAQLDYAMASCCKPIFGDEILGFTTIGKGVQIHRTNCSNAKELKRRYPYRVVKTDWARKGSSNYQATLQILGNGNSGAALDSIHVIYKNFKVPIKSMNFETNKTNGFEGMIAIEVPNVERLEALIEKLKTLKTVKKVIRYDLEN